MIFADQIISLFRWRFFWEYQIQKPRLKSLSAIHGDGFSEMGERNAPIAKQRSWQMPDENGVRTSDEWVAVKMLFAEHILRYVISSSDNLSNNDVWMSGAREFLTAMPEYPSISFDFESGWYVALQDGIHAIQKAIAQIPPFDLFDGKSIERIHLLITEIVGGYWHKSQVNSAFIWYTKKYGLIFSTQERRHFVKAINEVMSLVRSIAEKMDPTLLTFNIAGPETPEIELDDNGERIDE